MFYSLELRPEWVLAAGVVGGLLVQIVLFGLLHGYLSRRLFRNVRKGLQECTGAVESLNSRMETLEKSHRDSLAQVKEHTRRLTAKPLPPSAPPDSRRFGIDKKHQVVSLAKKGLGSADISRRLRIYQGEADLVLGLREYMTGRRTSHGREALQ